MKKKKSVSDFRYDTNASRVPWAAVGEPVREQDVAQIVRFLLRPAEGKSAAYEKQFKKVEQELSTLGAIGGYAGKLTLGNAVSELESKVSKFLGTQYSLFLTNWTA